MCLGELDMKLELEGIGIYVAKTSENNVKQSEKMTQTDMFPLGFSQDVNIASNTSDQQNLKHVWPKTKPNQTECFTHRVHNWNNVLSFWPNII